MISLVDLLSLHGHAWEIYTGKWGDSGCGLALSSA